jgi:hypothetical protein
VCGRPGGERGGGNNNKKCVREKSSSSKLKIQTNINIQPEREEFKKKEETGF